MKALLLKLWHDPLVNKAAHTFWQTFLALFLVGISGIARSLLKTHNISGAESALLSLVVASAAAAFSAVKTSVVAYLRTKP